MAAWSAPCLPITGWRIDSSSNSQTCVVSVSSHSGRTPHGQIIAAMYEAAGETLDVATYVRFAETAVAFVANGMGIALVDSFTAMQGHAADVRFLEIAQPHQQAQARSLPVYISRNLDAARPMIGETFEEIARTILLNVPRPRTEMRSGTGLP